MILTFISISISTCIALLIDSITCVSRDFAPADAGSGDASFLKNWSPVRVWHARGYQRAPVPGDCVRARREAPQEHLLYRECWANDACNLGNQDTVSN
jgi:hypothetical protein